MLNAAHELGIVPLETLYHDVNKALAALPPEDAKKMKRKFRKLWRKIARQKLAQSPSYVRRSIGLGNKEPDKKHKKNRKHEVKTFIYKEAVKPIAERSNMIEVQTSYW